MNWLDRPVYEAITRESFEACRTDDQPHRVCFATTHAHQPKRGASSYVGSFKLPFGRGLEMLFEADTKYDLYPDKYSRLGRWRSIQSEHEFQVISAWVRQQNSRVFLRDCLEISIALDLNFNGEGGEATGYSQIGEWEHRAKAKYDNTAVKALAERFCGTIAGLPFYRDAKLVAAVPPRPEKSYDLPQTLAADIAKSRGLTDLTPKFRFARSKSLIKALPVDQKWAAWEQTGLTLDPPALEGASVILIDDKYQSGTSLQFVASRLRAAGAGPIYGLCAVKTWRDTDNA